MQFWLSVSLFALLSSIDGQTLERGRLIESPESLSGRWEAPTAVVELLG